MWKLSKTFEFCYGHRVHNQVLNGEFADDLKTACRRFHGHEGKVVVYMEGEELERGMVTDLRHTEWAKKFFNTFVDHQFLMDINDPMFESFAMAPYNKLFGTLYTDKHLFMQKVGVAIVVPDTQHIVGYRIDMSDAPDTACSEFDVLDGITVLDFVPTSEHLAEWTCNWVQAKMSRIDVAVTQVDWWETPKSCASYQSA